MATYKKEVDYQALIDQAAAAGDYRRAAKLEQQRNAKIEGEGLQYGKTADYAGWLDDTDYGVQIKQAVASGGSKQEVADLLSRRVGKAGATKGMEQWVNDDIYDLAIGYLTAEPEGYRSSYAGRIDDLLARLEDREFVYAYEDDPLYQAYAKVYQREGRRAAQDALGMAAQNTGGFASTHAVAAAQQAGSYYSAKQADKIPELYQLAYEVWLSEGEAQMDQLRLLRDLDEAAYDRYRDTVKDEQWEAELEYEQLLDALENERYLEELAYDRQRDALEDARYEAEWQYELYRDRVADGRYAAQQAAKAAKEAAAAAKKAEGTITVYGLSGKYTQDEVDRLISSGLAEAAKSGRKTIYKLTSIS